MLHSANRTAGVRHVVPEKTLAVKPVLDGGHAHAPGVASCHWGPRTHKILTNGANGLSIFGAPELRLEREDRARRILRGRSVRWTRGHGRRTRTWPPWRGAGWSIIGGWNKIAARGPALNHCAGRGVCWAGEGPKLVVVHVEVRVACISVPAGLTLVTSSETCHVCSTISPACGGAAPNCGGERQCSSGRT